MCGTDLAYAATRRTGMRSELTYWYIPTLYPYDHRPSCLQHVQYKGAGTDLARALQKMATEKYQEARKNVMAYEGEVVAARLWSYARPTRCPVLT
eukprot:1998338-Rhodomonas_salina.2